MIEAVIFDLDNTLLDFMKMKEKCIQAAVESMIDSGLKVDSKYAVNSIFQIYQKKGWEYQEVFDDFLYSQLGKINYKILANSIIAYRKSKEENLLLYPNVRSTLEELSGQGFKLGVVSDAPSREAWIRICSVKLDNIFDAIVTFDDTKCLKPSPEPFKKITQDLNVLPLNCIMVGDWPERDVIGAKKIGMKTVFAKYGDTFSTVNSGADYDINNISEIIEIVTKENA